MTNATLPSPTPGVQPCSLTSNEIAEITGKSHAQILQDVIFTFSGIYAPRFYDYVCTAESKGIRGVKHPVTRGIVQFILQKKYVLALLDRYGCDGAYEFVDKTLSDPPEEHPTRVSADTAPQRKHLGREATKPINLNNIDGIVDSVVSEIFLNADFSEPDPGYVYVIEHQNGEVSKIGRSIVPAERIRVLYTEGGGHLRYFISDIVFEHKLVEKSLHTVLAENRRVGEWFSIPFDTVAHIVGRVAKEFPAREEKGLNGKLSRQYLNSLRVR